MQACTTGRPVWGASKHRCLAMPTNPAPKCGSRVFLAKTLENRTLCNWTAAFAGVRQLAQGPFHRIQTLNSCVYVSNLCFGPPSHIRALCSLRHAERQQFPNLSERKAKFLSAANESQPTCGFEWEETITRCAPRWFCEQPSAFVVTHGFQINPCLSGEPTDCESLHLHSHFLSIL